MNIRSILLKTIALIVCIFVLTITILPVIVSASSLTDSAKKTVLNTIEDIDMHVKEDKYTGYKEKLIALKKANPNWKFTLYYTGINWNTAIYNQTKGLHSRSLVQGKNGEWLCEECGTKVYDAGRMDVCIRKSSSTFNGCKKLFK